MFEDQPVESDADADWTYYSFLLKEADRGLEAGPEVEARLLRAFRRQRGGRWLRRASPWAVLAAAALVAMLVAARQSPEPAQIAVRTEVAAPVREALSETPAAVPPHTRQPLLRQVSTDSLPPASRSHGDDPVPADVLVGKEALTRAIRPIDFQP